MNPLTKAILVTGATGKQGGATIRNLANHPTASQFTLLAVTRNANSPSAQNLITKYPSIKLVQGDLNAVDDLFKSASAVLESNNLPPKIWAVYSVQTSMGPGVTFESEVAQGTSLIDAALSHGVQHFVYSSVERGGNEKSWDNPTPIPHFATKQKIEQYLREKADQRGENMNWTILRPVAFMDNIEPGFPTKVFLTALRDTLQGKTTQWVSIEDIGLFAGNALREPERWNARAVGIAGDELSVEGLDRVFRKVLGFPVPSTFSMLGSALMWAVKEVNLMINWFKTEGYAVDIAALKREESELCDFETWLKERSKFKAQ